MTSTTSTATLIYLLANWMCRTYAIKFFKKHEKVVADEVKAETLNSQRSNLKNASTKNTVFFGVRNVRDVLDKTLPKQIFT